jgi:hypothetical protein
VLNPETAKIISTFLYLGSENLKTLKPQNLKNLKTQNLNNSKT